MKRDKRGNRKKERRALTSLMCRGVEDGSSHAPKAHGLSLKLYKDEPSNCAVSKILFLEIVRSPVGFIDLNIPMHIYFMGYLLYEEHFTPLHS